MSLSPQELSNHFFCQPLASLMKMDRRRIELNCDISFIFSLLLLVAFLYVIIHLYIVLIQLDFCPIVQDSLLLINSCLFDRPVSYVCLFLAGFVC